MGKMDKKKGKAIGKKVAKGYLGVATLGGSVVAEKAYKRLRGGRGEAPDLGAENWNQQVVGESHYQKAISKAVGGQKDRDGSHWRGDAEISHDKKNKHDRYAVVVKINGKTVGYLPASETNRSLVEELQGKSLSVPARIKGGFVTGDGSRASYGVELSILEDPGDSAG